jgi:hypothetical protein
MPELALAFASYTTSWDTTDAGPVDLLRGQVQAEPMLLWALLASGQIQMRKVGRLGPFLSPSSR